MTGVSYHREIELKLYVNKELWGKSLLMKAGYPLMISDILISTAERISKIIKNSPKYPIDKLPKKSDK